MTRGMDPPLREWDEVWGALMRQLPGWESRTLSAIGADAGCVAGVVSRTRRGVGEVAPATVLRVVRAVGGERDHLMAAAALLGLTVEEARRLAGGPDV